MMQLIKEIISDKKLLSSIIIAVTLILGCWIDSIIDDDIKGRRK